MMKKILILLFLPLSLFGQSEELTPDGTGTYTEFSTAGEFGIWYYWDDASNATYSYSTYDAQKTLVSVNDCALTDEIIDSVKVKMTARASSTSGGGASMYIMVRTESLDYDHSLTAIPMTASFADYTYTWVNNPNTSTAWTISQVNEMEIGAKVLTVSRQLWIAEARATVYYHTGTTSFATKQLLLGVGK